MFNCLTFKYNTGISQNLLRTENYTSPKEPFGHPLYISTLKVLRGRREGSKILQQLALYPQPFSRDLGTADAIKNHLTKVWLSKVSQILAVTERQVCPKERDENSSLMLIPTQVPVKFESRQRNLRVRDYQGEQVFLSPLQSQAKKKASAPIIPKYLCGSYILNTKSTICLENLKM